MTVRPVDAVEHDAELLTLPVAESPATPEAATAAAVAEADQIRAGARRDAFLLYTSARQDAERLVEEAQAEAAAIVEAARAEAEELAAASRAAAEEAAARLLTVALGEQAAAVADVDVDVGEPEATPRRDGRSRYSVRSAKLPRLGDDAGRAALSSVANLRESFGE
jgi:cell division septum initiation protein DivIVA